MVLTELCGLLSLLLTVTVFADAAMEDLLCKGIQDIHNTPTTHTGYITSPNHPHSYPADNLQCTFKFHPKHNEQVQLTFSYFNLRESQQVPATTNCDLSDSVKVFVGTSLSNSAPGNQVGEYCGKKYPEIVMAVGRPLTVLFTVRAKENPQISAKYMFKAKYTFMKDYGFKTHAVQNHSAGCHFTFDGRRVSGKGEFDSPNFGGLYPFSTNCLYTFKAYGNQSIRLRFDKFEVEGQHRDCRRSEDDVVYIKHGDINWQDFFVSAEEDPTKRDLNTTLYCGLKSPPELLTNSPVVNIIFKSGQLRTRYGFRGVYQFVGHPGVYLAWNTGNTWRMDSKVSALLVILVWIGLL